jgi:hypothetical protein
MVFAAANQYVVRMAYPAPTTVSVVAATAKAASVYLPQAQTA